MTIFNQAKTLKETGLDEDLLFELVLKHLYDGGIQDIHLLSDRIKLAGTIVESLLDKLRTDARVEILSTQNNLKGYRYNLTALGRSEAQIAILKSAYIGPAPIDIEQYNQIVKVQSVFNEPVTKNHMVEVFRDIVMDEQLYDQLGPAVNSGRAILIYGHAGTGKTYICKKLAGLIDGGVYVPYAISVGKSIIQYFDPLIHRPIEKQKKESIAFELKVDPRLIFCDRPIAVSGGELSMDMLELGYNPTTHINQAPVQLKANNGMYIIDDLGRQKMPPQQLFNRWIVPMEEKQDFLTLETGKQFPVLFDTVLIFSTNLHPLELADEAFLRRLGYKIHFTPINKKEFTLIWNDICRKQALDADDNILETVFELYKVTERILLPCQPRDLIGLALDMAMFKGKPNRLTIENIQLAWDSYFINLNLRE